MHGINAIFGKVLAYMPRKHAVAAIAVGNDRLVLWQFPECAQYFTPADLANWDIHCRDKMPLLIFPLAPQINQDAIGYARPHVAHIVRRADAHRRFGFVEFPHHLPVAFWQHARDGNSREGAEYRADYRA